MDRKRKPSFREIYTEATAPKRDRMDFIREVCELTAAQPSTVELWLYGARRPTALAQKVLAEHFGCSPQELFPPKAGKGGAK